jgi:hypothetical protein
MVFDPRCRGSSIPSGHIAARPRKALDQTKLDKVWNLNCAARDLKLLQEDRENQEQIARPFDVRVLRLLPESEERENGDVEKIDLGKGNATGYQYGRDVLFATSRGRKAHVLVFSLV